MPRWLCAAFTRWSHSVRQFHLVQFVLCPVISFFLQSDWKSCFSQWVFMSSWANHKESLPVLSFPQWESWPRAWALTVALTITYTPLLPVISDYIRFGNKDILGCQGSTPSSPIPGFPWEWKKCKFYSATERYYTPGYIAVVYSGSVRLDFGSVVLWTQYRVIML